MAIGDMLRYELPKKDAPKVMLPRFTFINHLIRIRNEPHFNPTRIVLLDNKE